MTEYKDQDQYRGQPRGQHLTKISALEPLYCSQGGVPYNKAHLDAKDAEIKRLGDVVISATFLVAQLRRLLACALDEHDGNSGRFAAHHMPDHWTHEARRSLAQ